MFRMHVAKKMHVQNVCAELPSSQNACGTGTWSHTTHIVIINQGELMVKWLIMLD